MPNGELFKGDLGGSVGTLCETHTKPLVDPRNVCLASLENVVAIRNQSGSLSVIQILVATAFHIP